jgi:hypothetical protein
VALVKTATDAQRKIKAVATAKGLAFVDAALLSQIATTGISANGFTVSSSFYNWWRFSTDGVHPSQEVRTNNKFIEAINAVWSNLKGVDIGNYRILFQKLYSIRLYNLKTIPLGWF